MKNLVFTGPECSGKTTLAKQFAELSNGVFVAEYAREYINNLEREYNQSDLLEIAKGQFVLQEKAKKEHKNNLFFDTDLLTIKIWSDYKYGDCDPWILDRLKSNRDFTYVLCKPDIDWEYDEQRENPNDRMELFDIYKKELINLKLSFLEVKGRLENRIKFLEKG